LKSCSKLIGIVELDSRFVTSCDISPNSYVLAAGGLNNRCSIYIFDHMSPLMTCPALEFLNNSGHMLVSCNFLDENKIVCAHGKYCYLNDILKPTECNPTLKFNCHRSQISSSDSIYNYPNNFITCGIDKHVKLWDIRMKEPGLDFKMSSELNDVKSCRLNPNIFTVCNEQKINIFDIRTSKPIISFDAFLNNSELIGLEMSNSGRIIFASDDKGTIAGYDILAMRHPSLASETCQSVPNTAIELMSNTDDRLCMQMSNDGQTMVVGSLSGNIYLSQIAH